MIRHAFQSAKADSSDLTKIQPSHWNADHDISDLVIDYGTQIINGPATSTEGFNWNRTNGIDASADLTATGSKVVTLAPLPKGLQIGDHLRIYSGTGIAEVVDISGITGTAGQTGTIIVTTAQTHNGSWKIGTATAGFQEAIRYVVATEGGGTVLLPNGETPVYAQTIIPWKVAVRGVNRHSTIVLNQSTTTGVFRLDPFIGPDFSRACSLTHLTIRGASDGLTTMSVNATGVQVYGTGTGTEVAHISVWNHNVGIHLMGPIYSHVHHFMISNYGDAGIWYEYGDGNWITYGNISNAHTTTPVKAGSAGMLFRSFSGVYAHDIDVIGGYHSLKFAPQIASDTCNFGFFTRVLADTPQNHGWYYLPGPGGITSQVLTDCWGALAGYLHGSGYIFAGSGLRMEGTADFPGDITINGGRWRENGGHGINIDNTKWVKIVDSQIGGNSQFTKGGFGGVAITGAKHVIITDNQIGRTVGSYAAPAQNSGIYLAGGAGMDHVIVTGNDLSDFTGHAGIADGLGLVIAAPFSPNAKVILERNLLPDAAIWVSLNSAAVMDCPAQFRYFIVNGTANIGQITSGWIGREIYLLFLDSNPGDLGGNGALPLNIPRLQSPVRYEIVKLTFDGLFWY